MQKHFRSAVQTMAVSIVGQLARAQRMILDGTSVKHGSGGGGVRVSQQAYEALESIRGTYSVCGVVLESAQRAKAGDPEGIPFPHASPKLVRDSLWWQREVRVCHRHLMQISFMVQLHSMCTSFHIQLGGIPRLPVPRRAVVPAPWWTMQEDYDSLIGVMRYGWGNWKEICLDPDLCFAKQGVVWSGNASAESTAETNEADDKSIGDEVEEATPPFTPQKKDTKVFPAPHLMIKRLRRLLSAMSMMCGNDGRDDLSLDFSVSMSPKKENRNRGGMIDDWSQNELRNLRSTILRWGLPVPPSEPLLRLGKARSYGYQRKRSFFTVDNIPLTPEQDELEDRLAAVSTVLSGVLQMVCLKLNDGANRAVDVSTVSDTSETGENSRASGLASEGDSSANSHSSSAPDMDFNDDWQNHAWLDCYPVNCYDSQRSLGLFSNRLGPFEFLRIQAKLKTKTPLQVRRMVRQMEKRSIERFRASREHNDGESGKKEKEDINDVIPSNIVGQRIYRRLQLYYDLQQYVWDKSEAAMHAILSRWERDGSRRQDHLSEGWDVHVHDIALLRGVRKWGLAEWDLIWSDVELPFIRPVHDKKKEGETSGNRAISPNDEILLSMKKVNRSLVVGARKVVMTRFLD